jgi:UDPglucose 6-dehydrogenase
VEVAAPGPDRLRRPQRAGREAAARGVRPGDRGRARRSSSPTSPTAELVKVAANSFLATKISFINAMAEVCEAAGADVTQLAEAIGYDDRIGKKFLRAGVGFGGGCLPKDIRAFMAGRRAGRRTRR